MGVVSYPAFFFMSKFSRSDIKLAKHLFTDAIRKYFGEVWRIPSDGEYKGYSWECRSPIAFDAGIWRLCQSAKVKGAWRAAGRIETKDSGECLVFILFTNPNHKPDSLEIH